MSNPTATLPPGFRFHPTDEELILHYLRRRAASTVSPVPLISDVDIYKFNPWDLPCKAMFGEKEWYFFSPRDRKYPNGVRPNRAAASGYWKATGTDKPIHATSAETEGDHHQIIGVKKALVFYKGKPPKGLKTNWIMHEYRLISHPDHQTPIIHTFKPPLPFKDSSMRLDDWVLCRIYKKNNHHVSPERDHQQEESLMTSTTTTVHGLHKSSSLSELLNQLFDNPSEIFGFLDDDHQLLNGGNSTVNKHAASVSENPQKRLLEDGGGFQQPNFKKLNSSCFTNHQNGLMMISQPFLNQQIVLNSQLGLH